MSGSSSDPASPPEVGTAHRPATSSVTINSDMGEALGLHSFGNDEALMSIVDLANVACGFHAGDPQVMSRTVGLAADHGVHVGSHPGLPDLVGFGRRRMAVTADEVENLIVYQTGALLGFLDRAGTPLNHVKPHGALWGMLAGDEELMEAAATAVAQFDVPFLGLAGTYHESVCRNRGVDFIAELYVDMDYRSDGMLALSRTAHTTDPAAAAQRVATAIAGEPITSVDDTPVPVTFTSVCVHSDSRNATDVAAAVRATLDGQT